MLFYRHFFLFTLIPLLILTVGSLYLHFMVNRDYLVEYEGECDPMVASCFVGCEDDECSQQYYYSLIRKHAVALTDQCGTNITDCELAQMCLPEGDTTCSIIYCDPSSEENSCDTLKDSSESPEAIRDETSTEQLNEIRL